MLTITFYSMIGIFLYTIIGLFYGKYYLLPTLIPFFAVIFLFEYIGMDPVYLPAMLTVNFIWLLIFVAVTSLYVDNASMFAIATVLLVFMGVVRGGIAVNSFHGTKASYDTIAAQVSKSHKAPTMKRGETPVAIPPKTVFYKVNNDFGTNVPHYNSLELAPDMSMDEHGDDTQIEAQYYKGKPVYIIPLKFKSIMRYHKYRVLPGYFMIDATNPSAEPHFVRKPIHYGNGMYLHHNVDRNIYRKHPEYKSLSGEAQLEIDNNGHPYYVETEYKPTTFNTRPDFKNIKIAVEDGETGKVKFYNRHNAPKFVDENYGSAAADLMNKYYGHYKHGFLNYILWGNSGIKNPTENGPEDGVTTVFNANHTISYVTDYTSNSKSSTDIGSSAINARTGKLTYYRSHGVMDSNQAERNADNTLRRFHYSSDNPVMYDIDGHATWVMSMLDQSDLQRFWYYVDGNDPTAYSYDETPKATLDEFRSQLTSNGGTNSNSHAMKKALKKGTIDRFAIAGNKAVFTLKGKDKVYSVNISSSLKNALIHPGDKVSFKVGVNGSHSASALSDSSAE